MSLRVLCPGSSAASRWGRPACSRLKGKLAPADSEQDEFAGRKTPRGTVHTGAERGHGRPDGLHQDPSPARSPDPLRRDRLPRPPPAIRQNSSQTESYSAGTVTDDVREDARALPMHSKLVISSAATRKSTSSG